MLVIPQSEMDAILNTKIRRRTLALPVRREPIRAQAMHPRTGQRLSSPITVTAGTALRPCPVQVGGNYKIRGDRDKNRTTRITPRLVHQDGDVWLVSFWLDSEGKVRDAVDDSPVYLKRSSGYTTTFDEIDAGPVMTPLAKDIERARKEAREGRVPQQMKAVGKAMGELRTCSEVMADMANNVRVRRAMKELRAVEQDLAAEARATVARSECADRRSPVEDDQHSSASRGVEMKAA